VALDVDLVDWVRDLDESDLRRLAMLVSARLGTAGAGVDPSINVGFRSQSVKCGKLDCRSCPHGPYWYAYWREDGKARSLYLGKLDERELATVARQKGVPGYADGQ
jgi:hypothetical protein